MSKKKVFIGSNGCERRSLDCSRLGEYFRLNKCDIVNTPQKADYIIFVTCSFRETRENECWAYIEEYQKYKGELIVLGCLPEIAPNKFNQKFSGRYLSTKNLDRIDQFFTKFKIKFKDVPDANKYLNIPVLEPSFLSRLWKRLFVLGITIDHIKKSVRRIAASAGRDTSGEYAYLRVSNGCNEQCAYCCIYRAVGKLRSKSINVCVEEYKNILRSGYRKILILADNIGAYGLDIKSSLPELLNNLSTASDEEVHWYIQEMHPRWAILYRTELLRRVKEKKIREMVCAIQSGSNRILKLMNRHHGIEEIKDVLSELRRSNPGLKLYTQVIIGFPSETEEEFRETLNAIKEIRFDLVTIYPYYDGYGTIASGMDGKIDKNITKKRMREAVYFLEREGIAVDCSNIDLKL